MRLFKILLSLLYGLCITIVMHFVNGCSYSLGGEAALLERVEALRSMVVDNERQVPDSVLCVNVAYDKMLVDINDEYGMPQGTLPITDRSKLLRFLRSAAQANRYTYILLDISLLQGNITTEADDSLFLQICSMPRVAFVRKSDENSGAVASVSKPIREKSAYADYNVSLLESKFTKYPLFQSDEPTLPTHIYKELTGSRFTSFGPLLFCNGQLASRSVFVPLTVLDVPTYEGQEKVLYNLGCDILDNEDYQPIGELTSGRFVIIGDFTENDFHETYKGTLPGCIINYNAYLALLHNLHVVSFSSLLLQWLLFSIIIFFILHPQTNFVQPIQRQRWGKTPVVRLLLSWCSLTLLITVICVVVYLLTGRIYEILLTSTLFTAFSYYESNVN